MVLNFHYYQPGDYERKRENIDKLIAVMLDIYLVTVLGF